METRPDEFDLALKKLHMNPGEHSPSTFSDPEKKQHTSYSGQRPDVLKHVKRADRVLDVGCNVGSLARAICQKNPTARVWGIDINREVLAETVDVLEAAFCIDLDNLKSLQECLRDLTFDTIIAADVLEHTSQPLQILDTLLSRLAPNGEVIVSLPNFGHWETFVHLLCQKFPRRARGVYDDTHLRFFMRNNLHELERKGWTLTILERNFRLHERRAIRLDRYVFSMVRFVPWLREFFVFQWLLRISRR